MRAAWILLVVAAACGDNAQPPRLERVASLPAATVDVVFDRDGAVARGADGNLRRLVDGRWRTVAMNGARAIDVGTDTDGAVLVMSSIPRRLYQLHGTALAELGGIVIANYVHMPVQVPSGNRYVREIEGEQRSFVLSPGATTWAATPPMFFARPVRAYDGTLYAAQAAGVQRFEPDGSRTLAVPCALLARPACTSLVLGGADGERVVVGDPDQPEVLVVDGGELARVALPAGRVPVRIAVGAGVTAVLAKRGEQHALYALYADGALERVDTADDPPTAATLLAVDGEGGVHVASAALSRIAP